MWCVETLKNVKVPLCVGFMVCGDFDNFESFPVCGLYAVVCGYLENFQNSPVCGPVLERLIIFKKIPIGIFSLC